MINLTAHEAHATLPCLCKTCFGRAPSEASAAGVDFRRITVTAGPRELHAWLPVSLAADEAALIASMRQRLERRTARWPKPKLAPLVGRAKPSTAPPRATGLWARVRRFFGPRS